MADQQQGKAPETRDSSEPRGFGEHSRGLPGEYAHEQGWGLDEEERRRQPGAPRDTDGGNDYNYSAQDFGDEPANMARVEGDGRSAEQRTRRALGLGARAEHDHEQKENRQMASAHRQTESMKKHGDTMEKTQDEMSRRSAGSNVDPIPVPEQGSHEKSHAAHLGGSVHDRTKPEANPGPSRGTLREPPQEISRAGKEHRKQ